MGQGTSIGPERAGVLLDAFGGVEAVLTASKKELASITGIGPHTVKAIRWAVHEPDPAYDPFL